MDWTKYPHASESDKALFRQIENHLGSASSHIEEADGLMQLIDDPELRGRARGLVENFESRL